jgi:hypothetical protein
MVSIDVDLSKYTDTAKLTKDAQRRGMKLTAQEMIRNLMQKSPVDHGLLRQWAITSQSDSEVRIQSPAKYAAYQNYGTVPHWIEPVNAKALHWDGIFSKGHYVGGIEPKHFVEDSIEQTLPRIQEFFTINGD